MMMSIGWGYSGNDRDEVGGEIIGMENLGSSWRSGATEIRKL